MYGYMWGVFSPRRPLKLHFKMHLSQRQPMAVNLAMAAGGYFYGKAGTKKSSTQEESKVSIKRSKHRANMAHKAPWRRKHHGTESKHRASTEQAQRKRRASREQARASSSLCTRAIPPSPLPHPLELILNFNKSMWAKTLQNHGWRASKIEPGGLQDCIFCRQRSKICSC